MPAFVEFAGVSGVRTKAHRLQSDRSSPLLRLASAIGMSSIYHTIKSVEAEPTLFTGSCSGRE